MHPLLILSVLFFFPILNSFSETITLTDGTRIEALEIKELSDDKLEIKTKYGVLNIDKTDVMATPEIISTTTFSSVKSTEIVSEILKSTKPYKYVFKTINISTSIIQRIYFVNDVEIATQTIDSNGNILNLEGTLINATYREYYSDGKIKVEKTIMNGKENGPLKIYYENGILQSEANYLDGKIHGAVKMYTENGKILFEQNFKHGVPDGYFREYDDSGNLKSETFYVQGQISENSTPQQTQEKEISLVSPVTTKVQKVARGERIAFYLNSKYIGKIILDKKLNLTSKEGKIPDGAIKIYTKDGKLEKELNFVNGELNSIKIYNTMGAVILEGTYLKEKFIKK